MQQTDQLVEVRLYSVLGQLIQQKTMDASQNQVIESMDLPEAPGTYLIELVQEGEIIGRHKVQVTR
ncbi:MAG: T9SS type A sorting domain-containing protein [Crocinitomicaceae bacterium]|nr:MAG: T9SS type A sorting domain-containing protein [Crocinitomicaceae bacterium]